MRNRLDRPDQPSPAATHAACKCGRCQANARAALIDRLARDLAFIRDVIQIERRSEGTNAPPTYGTTHPRPIGLCSWETHRFLIRWHDAYVEARPTLDERAFILLRR